MRSSPVHLVNQWPLLPSHFHLVLPCSSCSAPTAGATKPLFTEVHRMAPGGGSPRLAPHGLRVLAGRVRGADLRGVGLQPGEDELRLRRSPTSMTDEVIGLCPTPSIGPFGAFWGGRVRRRKGSIWFWLIQLSGFQLRFSRSGMRQWPAGRAAHGALGKGVLLPMMDMARRGILQMFDGSCLMFVWHVQWVNEGKMGSYGTRLEWDDNVKRKAYVTCWTAYLRDFGQVGRTYTSLQLVCESTIESIESQMSCREVLLFQIPNRVFLMVCAFGQLHVLESFTEWARMIAWPSQCLDIFLSLSLSYSIVIGKGQRFKRWGYVDPSCRFFFKPSLRHSA